MIRRDCMKSHYEQAIQRYLMLCTILGCTLVLIWLISCIWMRGLIAIFLLLIILIVSKITISIVAKKTLLTVLFDKLDAVEFQKIVNDNRFNVPLIYRTSAAVSSGDYRTVINIASKSLSDKKMNIKVKYYYLSTLARVYFELRDFEKLKLLLEKYDEYQSKPSLKKCENENSIWEYYRYFLKSDYESCKLLCDLRNGRLKDNAWDTKLRKIQNDFLYAIACYENDEIDKAKQIFLDIIQKAPNLYLSILSKKHIDAIQGDELYFEEILPDNNYQFVENRKFKVIRSIRNACFVLVIVVLIVLEFMPRTKELSEYDKKLQIALSEQYTDFEILDYMNVKENGAVKDVLVFVRNEIEGIDVGFIMTYDNGISYNVKIMESNITHGSYSLESFTGNHSIELLISNQYYAGENIGYSTTVIKNSNKQYFVYAKCD